MKYKDLPSLSKFKHSNPWLYLWLYRFLQYFILFGFVVILGKLIISGYNVVPTDPDVAKYFLSSMVQAQSAIIALVVTFTLIAIQMAAASYTPRVVDVMKKNPDMWFLLIIYFSAISIGFIALKLVPVWDLVSYVLIFGIYTFLILFLYIINTIQLLRPDEVVKMLVEDINEGNIQPKEGTDDIVQSVFDVVHASINRFDVTTTRIGLNQLLLRIKTLLPLFDDSAKDRITEHFCEHIQRSSLIALQNEDGGTIDEILTVLEKFINEICEYKDDSKSLSSVISVISFIGLYAPNKRLENATKRVVNILEKIGSDTVDTGLENETFQVIEVLDSIGNNAINQGLEDVVSQVIGVLGKIGNNATDNGLVIVTFGVIDLLGDVGSEAADNGLEDATENVARVLVKINRNVIDNGFQDATSDVVDAFERVMKHAEDKGLDITVLLATQELWNVGSMVADNGLEDAAVRVVDLLGNVGEYAADIDCKDLISMVIQRMGDIGSKAADNGLEEATIRVVTALMTVGKYAANNGQKEVTLWAADRIERVGENVAKSGLWVGISTVVGENCVVIVAKSLADTLRSGPFTYSSINPRIRKKFQ